MSETAPIVANADPTQDQLAAGLRQGVLLAAAVASTLGYTQLAGRLSALLAIVGPLAAVAAFAWGQWRTRRNAQDRATLAAAAPDCIGVVR